jgi:ABC-type arginine transport system permease subunit
VEVNMFERVSLQQMVKNALPDLENRLLSAQLDLF